MSPCVSKEVLVDICSDNESQRSFPGQLTEVLTSTLEIEVYTIIIIIIIIILFKLFRTLG